MIVTAVPAVNRATTGAWAEGLRRDDLCRASCGSEARKLIAPVRPRRACRVPNVIDVAEGGGRQCGSP